MAEDLNAFQCDPDSRETLAERLVNDAPPDHHPALRTLVPLVYDELRAIAVKLIAHRPTDACLQPTAVVHEAFIKLASAPEASWSDRSHFLALSARVMRQVLADHIRDERRLKRGGGERRRLTLTTLVLSEKGSPVDAMALDDALARLEEIEPRAARVAEMRFLAGMTVEEVSSVMEVSPRTIELDWRAARAWLRRELGRD
ncbi:MAG: sigma-70 family RNA polymerase sigma factor [Phycisphaerae bacterium]|jgi:RNA polymerase sigma-70 factor (ECF subfamily)|nr:sigma-70 family RNA polymerase sigma factor [Phycisphaerae bacterium]